MVLDRYLFSTLAYHRLLLGSDLDFSLNLYGQAGDSFIFPDLTIFVTASKEAIEKRIAIREKGDTQKQWYGDAVSLSCDLASSYKAIFSQLKKPYFHLDTSSLTPEEGTRIIMEEVSKLQKKS